MHIGQLAVWSCLYLDTLVGVRYARWVIYICVRRSESLGDTSLQWSRASLYSSSLSAPTCSSHLAFSAKADLLAEGMSNIL